MKVKVTAKKRLDAEFKVIAYCNMTGRFEGAFESMEDLRKCWPSAEITRIDEGDGYIIVYC